MTDAQCDATPVSTTTARRRPGDDFNAGDTDLDGYLDGGETWQYTCTTRSRPATSNGEEDPILNTADAQRHRPRR